MRMISMFSICQGNLRSLTFGGVALIVGGCPISGLSQPVPLTSAAPIFHEEFQSFSQTPNKTGGTWQTQFLWGQRTLPQNGERQYYSDNSVGPNPFTLGKSVLSINAEPEANPAGLPYVSGIITSYPSFSRTYGYFEMRARLPQGAGMWPAFWLLPHNGGVGEIDIMEAFGASYQEQGGCNQIHWALHGAPTDPSPGTWVTTSSNICTGFHVYGVDWEAATITWYLDGIEIAQQPTPSWANSPFYVLANLAVGGTWPGPPAGESASMQIDYIRVYAAMPNSN
jgi:beta-glucanase (GH16 family)